MWGGEIFVPKIPSYRIMDVAQAVAPDCRVEVVGIRPGEKLHEEMITVTDAINTVELEDGFVILPSTPLWDIDFFMKEFNGSMCPENFCYNSGNNSQWLSVEELRKLIIEHVDHKFTI